MVSPLTPLDFLARSASVYRERVAIVQENRRFTYGEFGERAHRLAAALQALGIGAGDRVAVLAFNGVMPLEAHFGPMLIGAVLVILNLRLAAPELAWILKHCGAKVLLVDPELRCLAPCDPDLQIIDDYEAFLAGAPDTPILPPVADENSLIAINYTSGTTGFPKGVMFTHRGAWVNAMGELTEHGLDARSVYLWTLPMFHCNGWCFTWAVTAAGARHICLPRPDPAESVRLIEAEGVTHLCGAPVVVASLAQYCADRGIRFSTALAHRHGRRAAHSRGDPRGGGDRRRTLPHLRAHRNLRASYHLPAQARVARPDRRTAGPGQSAPGSRLPGGRHGSARGGCRHAATFRAMPPPWARC